MGKTISKTTARIAAAIVAALAFVCPGIAPAQQAPLIYGSMTDNKSWSTWERAEGIYSFTPVVGSKITPVYTDGYDLAATGGGVLVDDTYHLFYHREGSSSMFSVTYSSFNIDDWSVTYECYFSSVIASNDMAYDPVTDKVYCAHKDRKLVLWDPYNIDNVSTIGSLAVEIVAIAANAQGDLYGIGTDGALYAISKADGALQLIGQTGIMPKGYQSAVFDFATGALYWAAYTKAGKSALYSVNTATGAAEKIYDFPNNARFAGLYILGSAASESAPAAPADLAVAFPNGSNQGTISFTMPTETVGGASLSGALQYTVEVDEDVFASGTADAGQAVSLDATIPTGEHKFTVVAANEAGEGPRAKCIAYVGKGIPGYVDYPTAAFGDEPNQIIVTWTAPDYCMPMDAYFDPAELRYDVVRLPDNALVASAIAECQAVDNIAYDGELAVFKYQITPRIGDIAGFASVSNGLPVGQPLQPPFEAQMAGADLDFFTIIDANGDGSSWVKDWYGYGVCCGGRYEGDCDDWIMLPPLHLEDKGLYHAVVNVGNDYDGVSQWELKIGMAPNPDAMTQTLLAASPTTKSYDGDIRVSQPGAYYIGIHCIGRAGATMYLTDVLVRDEANYDAPDAPITLSGVGAERGELAAYVTFTTPSMTIGGDRLDNIDAVNIYHGEKLVYTLENVEIDTEYTCKVEADQEFNEYSVAAVNEHGEGARARIQYVFAGYDFPAPAQNIVLAEAENGQPLLTWDPASEEGLYGYFVNTDEVVYEIYRGYGNDTYDLIEEAFAGNTYIDESLDLDCDQFMLQYYIYAVNSIGRTYGASCASQCFGRPFAAPFVETFPDGNSEMRPWYFHTSDPQAAGWNIVRNSDTNVPDYDLSNGMMAFYGLGAGNAATLFAPYVSIKGAADPILDFFFYADDLAVAPTVKVNGADVANSAKADGAKGWQRFCAPLDAFAQTDRIKIEISAASAGDEAYAFIDNVRVRQAFAHDLAIQSLVVPAAMELGQPCQIGIVIKNDGNEPSQAADFSLSINGFAAHSCAIEPLEPAQQRRYEIAIVPDVAFGSEPVFYASIDYSLDQCLDNNASAETASSIKLPRYPAPDGLQAVADDQAGTVTLSWSEPDTTPLAPDPVIEDFESYDAFAIEMQPWTLIDADQQATSIMSDPVTWYEYLDYPHAGEPMAYQIFDPAAVGIDTSEFVFYAPHSGSKAAVCWSTNDWGVANDDWLISPELFPGGQTISFFVYSRTGYFDNEKYEVLYSPAGAGIADFILLASDAATDEWTKVAVELPADAKRFAIRTVSSMSSTEIWFDDIAYIPATAEAIVLDLVGYNVYRDNVKVNAEPINGTTFVDDVPGAHKYNVSAVYGVGESPLSASVMATVADGLPSSATSQIAVSGGKGCIRVKGAAGRCVAVYSVAGMRIANVAAAANDCSLAAAPGAYVVNIDGNAYKVIVR